jgi:hypothetical protein
MMEIGYPRTGAVIDRQYKTIPGPKWSEPVRVLDGETIRQVDQALRFATEELDKACDSMNEAAVLLEDFPDGDRLQSLLHDMEKLLAEAKAKQQEYGRRAG